MKLKGNIIELIKKDSALFSALMVVFSYKESDSLRTKLRQNHPNLTRQDVLVAISKHTGLTQSELLEGE